MAFPEQTHEALQRAVGHRASKCGVLGGVHQSTTALHHIPEPVDGNVGDACSGLGLLLPHLRCHALRADHQWKYSQREVTEVTEKESKCSVGNVGPVNDKCCHRQWETCNQ